MEALGAVLTLIAAGGGSYLGSYLKKKGENLATHEDIDKLVTQVAAVTQTTKEIEAKISNDVWQRQRSWEVKRDALFRVVRDLAAVEYAVRGLTSAFEAASKDKNRAQEHEKWEKLQGDKTAEFDQAMLEFEKTKALAVLVCDDNLDLAFLKVDMAMGKVALSGMTSDYGNVPAGLSALTEDIGNLRKLVREQLRIAA